MANEKEDRANEERDVDKELLALFGGCFTLHLEAPLVTLNSGNGAKEEGQESPDRLSPLMVTNIVYF